MNGALGRRVYGFSETSVTVTSAARSAFAMPVAAASSSWVALRVGQRAVVGEVAAGRDLRPVDAGEARGEEVRLGIRGEVALDVPVARGAERHPLALALDDEAGRDGLHAAGGEAGLDLAPQHRADLVAVEPVEDATGLLGVDEPGVDLAGGGGGALDGLRGDLVEDHPLDRDLGLEGLEQVPGDRLALAVLIRGEVELVGVLEQRLELADLLLLVGVDDVVGLEVVVDVDAELAEGALLDVGRHLARRRDVADVADRRLDVPVAAEVAGDGPRLRRRLDDDELASAHVVHLVRSAAHVQRIRRCSDVVTRTTVAPGRRFRANAADRNPVVRARGPAPRRPA